MAITIVQSGGAASANGEDVTTIGVDTSGATLLVAITTVFTGTTGTLTDSKTNIWVPLTLYDMDGAGTQIYYVNSATPNVGTGHTFTITGGGGGAITALSFVAAAGTVAAPLDAATGDTSGTSVASIDHAGGITPSEDNTLVIAGVTPQVATVAPSIDGGFTLIFANTYSVGVHQAHGAAYLIQTAAALANPTWSWTTNSVASSAIASFKAAAAVGGLSLSLAEPVIGSSAF